MGLLLFPLFGSVSSIIYGDTHPGVVISKAVATAGDTKHITHISDMYMYILNNKAIQHYMWQEFGVIKIVIDQLIQLTTFATIFLLFWIKKQATPGKLLLQMKIIDFKTKGAPSVKQLIIRLIGYIISTIPMFLGFFWVIFDKNKRGWHDYLSGTEVVNVKKQRNSPKEVKTL